MGSNDELSLEKLEIHNRLVKVEEHMIEGVEVRKSLVKSMNKLEDKMDKTYTVVFGGEDKIGIAHQMETLVGIASKILWLVASAVILAALPTIADFISKVLHK